MRKNQYSPGVYRAAIRHLRPVLPLRWGEPAVDIFALASPGSLSRRWQHPTSAGLVSVHGDARGPIPFLRATY
jgi:hypothetical protein